MIMNVLVMNKIILSIIVILLLPISVYGFDWKVKYDMKKSDGSYEFVELSVPEVDWWELPNQVGSWKCLLRRYEPKQFVYSEMSLHCRSKIKDEQVRKGIIEENETISLLSKIKCDNKDTKKNELGVNFDSHSKGIPNTVIVLKCSL